MADGGEELLQHAAHMFALADVAHHHRVLRRALPLPAAPARLHHQALAAAPAQRQLAPLPHRGPGLAGQPLLRHAVVHRLAAWVAQGGRGPVVVLDAPGVVQRQHRLDHVVEDGLVAGGGQAQARLQGQHAFIVAQLGAQQRGVQRPRQTVVGALLQRQHEVVVALQGRRHDHRQPAQRLVPA